MRWFAGLIDPVAAADGPPPDRLWAFMRWALSGTGKVLIALTVASLLLGLAETYGAALLGWVVDLAVESGPQAFFVQYWPELVLIAAFFMIARPLFMTAGAALTSLSVWPNVTPLATLRLHRHTLGQSLKFFEDDYAGRLAQKQLQTARAMAEAVVEVANHILFALATVGGAMWLMGDVDVWLIFILFGWLAAYVGLIAWFLPKIRKRSEGRAAARAALSGQLVDSLSHMATVKLFAYAAREEAAAEQSGLAFREASLRFGRMVTAFRGTLMILSGVLPVALTGAALWFWSVGQASPGDITVAGLLSTRIAQMSGWISFAMMGIFTNLGEAEDGMRTLTPAHAIVDRPGAYPPPEDAEEIRFDDVTFLYGKAEGGGLDGFDLTVRRGESVGLVGRSGAGKSTALTLLARLHDVEGGRIALGGHDIRDLTQDGLRRQVALVTQEAAMFNRSALDNIRYGTPGATEAQAIDAAKRAAAHEFILELRDVKGREGYAAHLGERGVKLSGGQRQRIALARAILKDAPVLALDEATSALDSETEAAVQAALERLVREKTVIAIAHRLSTIARLDRIVVMDEGRVVEAGTHRELLSRGGLYAQFWARQSGGFIGVEAAE